MFIIEWLLMAGFVVLLISPLVFTVVRAIQFKKNRVTEGLFKKLFVKGIIIGFILPALLIIVLLIFSGERGSPEDAIGYAILYFYTLLYLFVVLAFNSSAYVLLAVKNKTKAVSMIILILWALFTCYLGLTGGFRGVTDKGQHYLRGQFDGPPKFENVFERCQRNDDMLYYSYEIVSDDELSNCVYDWSKRMESGEADPYREDDCYYVSMRNNNGDVLCKGKLPDCESYTENTKNCEYWDYKADDGGKWVDVLSSGYSDQFDSHYFNY